MPQRKAAVRKIVAAEVAYGEHSCVLHQPGTYGIFDEGGELIGKIVGSTTGYMDPTDWEVWIMEITEDGSEYPVVVKRFDSVCHHRPFSRAKAWIRSQTGAELIAARDRMIAQRIKRR